MGGVDEEHFLRVQTANGVTVVSPVTKIIVPNGSLTDNGGGSILLTFGGGGGSQTPWASDINANGYFINDSSGKHSIGPDVRGLYNELGGLILTWGSTSSTQAGFNDVSGNLSADITHRILYDSFITGSLNYQSRNLLNENGVADVSWDSNSGLNSLYVKQDANTYAINSLGNSFFSGTVRVGGLSIDMASYNGSYPASLYFDSYYDYGTDTSVMQLNAQGGNTSPLLSKLIFNLSSNGTLSQVFSIDSYGTISVGNIVGNHLFINTQINQSLLPPVMGIAAYANDSPSLVGLQGGLVMIDAYQTGYSQPAVIQFCDQNFTVAASYIGGVDYEGAMGGSTNTTIGDLYYSTYAQGGTPARHFFNDVNGATRVLINANFSSNLDDGVSVFQLFGGNSNFNGNNIIGLNDVYVHAGIYNDTYQIINTSVGMLTTLAGGYVNILQWDGTNSQSPYYYFDSGNSWHLTGSGLGLTGTNDVADGTYTPVTSITVLNGRITAIS
jgi:hypothetical protein